jgi:ATP/maltotriose-dependent transcriptional regulator MalT
LQRIGQETRIDGVVVPDDASRSRVTHRDNVEQARAAWQRHAWGEAYTQLRAADLESPLDAADVERLAIAAYLAGRDEESEELLARAHQSFLDAGAIERSVRCAFWLAYSLLNRREEARGGGWLARAQTLLDDVPDDCVERGYLVLPDALRSAYSGDLETAQDCFSRAADIARSFRDADLAALALSGRGRVLIRMGDVARGTDQMDEAMAAVEAGVVSPWVAGDVYCTVIEGCTETFDVRRAADWTGALSRWCESQPDLVPFRGQCLIRRSEILQLRGAWVQALQEAQQACTRLSEPPRPAVGLAWYQRAELHRLRGEFAEAEAAYRESSRWTRAPRPGLALLRLAQGRVAAATAAIQVLLQTQAERSIRAKVLAAAVEIALAAGDVGAARAAADELSELAQPIDATFLRALSAHATGAVLLAEGNARAALPVLQRAWSHWQELDAPYDAARVRVLVAVACRQLEDRDTADMELAAAREVFRQLGAAPDSARVDALSQRAPPSDASGLTRRELEVLRLVARGDTNRMIAGTLFISEKTVHRHLSNIFRKLGLSSRTAAAAYAFEHQLV